MLKLISGLFSRLLYPPCHDLLVSVEKVGAKNLLGVLDISVDGGWHMIECQAKASCVLIFSGDYPPHCGKYTFELPVRKAGMAKRIIFLRQGVTSIQLSVEGLKSIADIQYLRFIPLRRSFAVNRMLRRLQVSEEYMLQHALRSNCTFDVFLSGAYDNLFSSDREAQYRRWVLQSEPVLLERYAADFANTPEPNDSDFVIFCAQGCQLSLEAERLMMLALQDDPRAKLVYPDEDIMSFVGQRSAPFFKPDWNPDLFLAHDYISSCYICRREWYEANRLIFDKHGGNLALTYLLPAMKDCEIKHIPLVLAHIEEQQAVSDDRLYHQRASVLRKVLPLGASVEPGLIKGTLNVRYAFPAPPPLVSLLIPTRDGLQILKPCVESILRKTTYPNFEILILNNQSRCPETLDWLDEIQKDSKVKVLSYDHPFNYSAINNFGVRHARGDVIGLINNDVEVIASDWLSEMVRHALRPEIGCVGAKLCYSNGQIQHGGVILGLGDVAGHAHRFLPYDDSGYQGRLKLIQNYSAVTAACLLVRRKIFEDVGGLEERYLTVAYNDVDFCLRVKEAGYRNLWTPYAELYHHESISRGDDNTPEKQLRYEKEVAYMQSVWGEKLKKDPCYNPNLSLHREDFSLGDLVPKGDFV